MIASMSTPTLRFASQSAPPSASPQGDNLYDHIEVGQAYAMVDDLVVKCQAGLSDPQTAAQTRESITKASQQVKSQFKDELVNATAAPATASQGRQAAMGALVGGMLAGALDTLLIMATDQAAPTPQPSPAPPSEGSGKGVLSGAIDHMLDQLHEKLAEAKEELKAAGAKALQTASQETKTLGDTAVNKAADLAEGHWSLHTYQGFDASAFALGYSTGIADAALISLGLPLEAQPPAGGAH